MLKTATGLNFALLDRGWAYHYHRKCAILMRTGTAQKLVDRIPNFKGGKEPSIWRSPNYNSIGITLSTLDGTLFLASSYLPPGVEDLPSDPDDPARRAIEAQHKEIALMAARHDHSALSFDGNETITKRGRIQTKMEISRCHIVCPQKRFCHLDLFVWCAV